MNIAIIEDGFFEREWLIEELKKTFPSSFITEFKTAGDFLLALGTPTYNADIIILEHHLPLGEVKPDIEEWCEKLDALFPEVPKNWKHQEAGERLVRHLRKNGVNTPIIIYTHSNRDWVSVDIWKYPKVAYCFKNTDVYNLIRQIRKFVPVQV